MSGIPGSGKTTLAAAVAEKVNQLEHEDKDLAVCIPMDGYHLSRAQLAAMPDYATAIHRRGAAFTFDAEAFHFIDSFSLYESRLFHQPQHSTRQALIMRLRTLFRMIYQFCQSLELSYLRVSTLPWIGYHGVQLRACLMSLGLLMFQETLLGLDWSSAISHQGLYPTKQLLNIELPALTS